MRVHLATVVALVLASACEAAHGPSVDTGPDAARPAACPAVPATTVARTGALRAWIGTDPASRRAHDEAYYADLFQGIYNLDFFVPLDVEAIDSTHARVTGVVASDHRSCTSGSGDSFDCSTHAVAATARYELRLDAEAPLATLIDATPISQADGLAAFSAIATHEEQYPLCAAVGEWDLLIAPADSTNGPTGPECYVYLPPAFAAVLLIERTSGRAWEVALPVLPGACADTWAAGGSAQCVPTIGAGGDPAPRTLVFIAAPLDDTSVYPCALETMCVGACAGCWPDGGVGPYTAGSCVADVDATWMRAACAATRLADIPSPTVVPRCTRSCMVPPCPAAAL